MSKPVPNVDAQRKRILVVDDNQPTAMALARVLELEHYTPVVALRGSDALDQARIEPCAAALVDIHLPDLNGLVLAQRLRELMGSEAPIVIVSGDTSMEVINALHHVGATYFFSKPLNAQHLVAQLKEWMGQRPGDGQG